MSKEKSQLPSGAIDNAGLRWVPCSEGMPTNHAIYFVKRSNGNKNTDFFCDPKTYYNGKQRVWLNYDDIVEWLDESSPIPTHKK